MSTNNNIRTRDQLAQDRLQRASTIANAGGLMAARTAGTLPKYVDISLSEALILGLLQQGINRFITVLGHGSTEIGEILRIYRQAGLVKVFAVRSEIEASHAAAALRWLTGEKAAVVTSIGPGALQALSASLVPNSNGLGVWYLLGDETSQDEGPNMQQIPRQEQTLFLKLFSTMGQAYSLHTPLALPTALRRGLNTVDAPHRGGPFFLLLPMNTQAQILPRFNLDELPAGAPPHLGAAADPGAYRQAVEAVKHSSKILVRSGGGSRTAGPQILEFMEITGAAAITAPVALGVIPDSHPQNMTVGGSKGSISGNFAMDEADLLVVIGSRAVCQSDCSRTGFPSAQHVININTDPGDATHYNRTIALLGDAAPTLRVLIDTLKKDGYQKPPAAAEWLRRCAEKRAEWDSFRQARYDSPTLYDEVWGREVLTQPAAIKAAADWAMKNNAVSIFDAGDVQANGFQVVAPENPGQTVSDTGASYMGFAVSALLATTLTDTPIYAVAFTGDGSFTMNPQILWDGVEHGARGCILLFDNRRMGAISGLQIDQFGVDFASNDSVDIDYVALAGAVRGVKAMHGGYSIKTLIEALDQARTYPGLSLIHLPVYYGPHPLGGLGVYGRWNVGPWSEDTQKLRHEIGL